MLREYQSKQELEELLKETQLFPCFINIHFDILTKIKERLPENVSRYFVYRNNDGKYLIILFRKYNMAPFRPMLSFCYDTSAKFEKDLLWKIFDEISSVTQSLNHYVPVTCIYDPIAAYFKEWYDVQFKTKTLGSNPCFLYYMTKEQQDLLNEKCQNGTVLPEGYYFAESNFKSDIDIIIETGKFCNKFDFPIIEALLRQMPYVLIRHKSGDGAVAFEYVDARGCMNHQFVLPEHRSKGLGSAVEKAICLKLIKQNMTPFKFVEKSNEDVILSSNKSKFWTCWKDENGPVTQHWMTEREL